MSELIHRKSALIPMGAQCVALLSLLVLLSLPTITFAQSSYAEVHVVIPNIKNSTGNIACGIFESEEGFPSKFLGEARVVIIKKIEKEKARCRFFAIPPGTYAIAIIHDENMNGKLDTNWFGVPKEGYGFSNTTPDEFGSPAFSTASFEYEGNNMDLTIKLSY